MWRTGGTYLAFMLRERNPVALFYEPLHEDYSKFTRADWDGFAARGDGVTRGHPTKDFHYLTDYPFLPGGGVEGHRAEFAYDRFVLAAGDPAPELRTYLNGLLRHAETTNRRPLFKFCRGFLRQRWLQAQLDPVIVYLVRKPSGMISSYERIGSGGYFYSGFLRILRLNRRDAIFAPVYEYVARLSPNYATASAETLASDQLAKLAPEQLARDVFLFFWALALAAHCASDVLVLDANAFGADPENRARCGEALSRHTGLEANFADAAELDPGDQSIPTFTGTPDFVRFTEAAVRSIAPNPLFSKLSPALQRQLWALLTVS